MFRLPSSPGYRRGSLSLAPISPNSLDFSIGSNNDDRLVVTFGSQLFLLLFFSPAVWGEEAKKRKKISSGIPHPVKSERAQRKKFTHTHKSLVVGDWSQQDFNRIKVPPTRLRYGKWDPDRGVRAAILGPRWHPSRPSSAGLAGYL